MTVDAPTGAYSSSFGAVLASVRAVTTRMIVFESAVADLSEALDDPVDLLFGTELGAGPTSTKRSATASRSSRVLRRPSWRSSPTSSRGGVDRVAVAVEFAVVCFAY
jgi:hypothetical protein